MGWLLWLVFPLELPPSSLKDSMCYSQFLPFWDIYPLSYSRELFLSLLSCVPHGLLSFTIVLVASLLCFSAENKRKRKEKGADLFFVSGNDVFRPPCFVV